MTSIDWSLLRHAYGPAANIPGLLAEARSAPVPSKYTTEPWYSLWSSLYHQGDIYDASFAALPDLVQLALQLGGDVGIESMLLAASIELRRNEAGAPALPAVLAQEYLNALVIAREVAASLAGTRSDAPDCTAIVHAVFRGDYSRARQLLDEDDSEA